MSNSNRSSASQTQRAAITLHSGYGAAGGIQTHDPCFRRPGLSGKCMSLHHCGISTLSVQESTVFPICHSNSCSSTHELVGIEGFGPSRLSTLGLETSVAAISPYPHIAGLSRLSAPLRAFSEEENVLITHYQAYQRYP